MQSEGWVARRLAAIREEMKGWSPGVRASLATLDRPKKITAEPVK